MKVDPRGQRFAAALTALVLVAVLITSSLTMALAVHAAQLGRRTTVMIFIVLTMVLGTVFLGIKGVEYYHKFTEHHVPGPTFQFEKEYIRNAQLFFSLYFMMTGLHAVREDLTHPTVRRRPAGRRILARPRASPL